MANAQKSPEKVASDFHRLKVSKPIGFGFLESPAVWDKTEETRFVSAVGIESGEARIPKPVYDVASSVIPLRSSASAIDINPTSRMGLLNLEVIFNQVSVVSIDAINSKIDSKITLHQVALKLPPLQIYGMNYADKHFQKIILSKDDDFQSKPEKSKGEKREVSIVDSKKRRQKRKVEQPLPSIWDLLFAVLQPPLSLGQSENLLLPKPLFPYQPQGIKFLMDNEHALLADDMGTGKTVMTVVALKIPDSDGICGFEENEA